MKRDSHLSSQSYVLWDVSLSLVPSQKSGESEVPSPALYEGCRETTGIHNGFQGKTVHWLWLPDEGVFRL